MHPWHPCSLWTCKTNTNANPGVKYSNLRLDLTGHLVMFIEAEHAYDFEDLWTKVLRQG